MDSFDDVTFPMALARLAAGGPERRVEIWPTLDGGEAVNAPWAASRRRFSLSGLIRPLAECAALAAFFEARGGRARSFRFTDIFGDQATAVSLGLGDGVRRDFPTDDGGGHARLVRPTSLQTATAASLLDPRTIRFAVAPAAGVPVTASFAFDRLVRFDTDALIPTPVAQGAARIEALAILEIRP
jgi:hypothetical protein